MQNPNSHHAPHKQLKAIRKCLAITQKKAAAMLGVSYPYFLSIETGQRELSGPLASRIAKIFGVAQIEDKSGRPLMRDSNGDLVPFTKERYEKNRSRLPSYFIEQDERLVRPTAEEYAQCTRALLEAAREEGTMARLLADFFPWFETGIRSDTSYDNFSRKFDELFGRKRNDAFWALTGYRAEKLDHEVGEYYENLDREKRRKKKKRRA
jgi:transcriptional regulator with XRE-family HTH domain